MSVKNVWDCVLNFVSFWIVSVFLLVNYNPVVVVVVAVFVVVVVVVVVVVDAILRKSIYEVMSQLTYFTPFVYLS